MKAIAMYIGIAIVAALGITLTATKVVPLFEDLRVVEPIDGVQCAIVSRVAHTSIDCWKKERLSISMTSGVEDLLINHIESPHPADATTVAIEPMSNEGLLIEGGYNMSKGLMHITIDDVPVAPTNNNLYFKSSETVITPLTHRAISFTCGEGRIEIDYGTGEAIFTEGCNPSEASKEIWEGIRPYFDMDIRRGLYLKMNPPEVS